MVSYERECAAECERDDSSSGGCLECGEVARILGLVAAVRAGGGDVLVIRGEPGIGKSALIAAAAEAAGDLRVASTRGTESEVEVPLGGLFELVLPLIDNVAALPGHFHDVLMGALSLGPPKRGSSLTVGVATLATFTTAAEALPILVVVDDAHWVDTSSLQALLFAGRRLAQDGVGMVFGVRDGESQVPDTAGIENSRWGHWHAMTAIASLPARLAPICRLACSVRCMSKQPAILWQ